MYSISGNNYLPTTHSILSDFPNSQAGSNRHARRIPSCSRELIFRKPIGTQGIHFIPSTVSNYVSERNTFPDGMKTMTGFMRNLIQSQDPETAKALLRKMRNGCKQRLACISNIPEENLGVFSKNSFLEMEKNWFPRQPGLRLEITLHKQRRPRIATAVTSLSSPTIIINVFYTDASHGHGMCSLPSQHYLKEDKHSM